MKTIILSTQYFPLPFTLSSCLATLFSGLFSSVGTADCFRSPVWSSSFKKSRCHVYLCCVRSTTMLMDQERLCLLREDLKKKVSVSPCQEKWEVRRMPSPTDSPSSSCQPDARRYLRVSHTGCALAARVAHRVWHRTLLPTQALLTFRLVGKGLGKTESTPPKPAKSPPFHSSLLFVTSVGAVRQEPLVLDL